MALIDLNGGVPNQAMPLLSRLVREAGAEPVAFEARMEGRLPRRGFAATILTGGPGAPLASEPWRPRLLHSLRPGRATSPTLGICLGFQLLAVAHGWRVRLLPRPRFGLRPVRRTAQGERDPLLAGLRDDSMAFEQRRWGVFPGASLRRGLPLSLGSQGEALAVRFSPWACGTVFHPEAEPGALGAWLSRDPEARRKLAEREGPDALDQTLAALPRLEPTWTTVIPGFLQRALRATAPPGVRP